MNEQEIKMTRKFLIVCLCTIASLFCFSSAAVADLVLADGGPTGQWWNPDRNGEGFFIEIIEGPPMQIGIAMYSYDAAGKPLWLVGNIEIGTDDQSADIPVFQFDGPKWGPGYDPGDLNRTPFGNILVRFPTCDSALFYVLSNVGLESGNYSLVRITSIEGINCVEPSDPPPVEGYTPGRWDGDGVCFNVAQDGMSITGVGSSCANGAAFAANLFGVSEDTGDCGVEFGCAGPWPIEDGSFACTNGDGDLVVGNIDSSGSASGLAFKERGGVSDYCTAPWSATPN